MMISWGKHDFWTPRPRPENPPAKKYRYGEYPNQVDPTSREYTDRYYEYPKLQTKAVYLVQKAIRKGFVIKRESCQLCGGSDRLVAHHESYYHPLMIVWVCTPCHTEIHQNKRYGRDHSSMCPPVVGVVVNEGLTNFTLGYPVGIVPEFVEEIKTHTCVFHELW